MTRACHIDSNSNEADGISGGVGVQMVAIPFFPRAEIVVAYHPHQNSKICAERKADNQPQQMVRTYKIDVGASLMKNNKQ